MGVVIGPVRGARRNCRLPLYPDRHRKKRVVGAIPSVRRAARLLAGCTCPHNCVASDNHRIAGNRRSEPPPENVPVFFTQVAVSEATQRTTLKKKVAPEGRHFLQDVIVFYALLRRRRYTPKPTRAEPRTASEAGSGVLTPTVVRVSLQVMAPP